MAITDKAEPSSPFWPGPPSSEPQPHPKPEPAKPAALTEDQKIARVQRALASYRHNMKHNAPRTPQEYKELHALLLGDKPIEPVVAPSSGPAGRQHIAEVEREREVLRERHRQDAVAQNAQPLAKAETPLERERQVEMERATGFYPGAEATQRQVTRTLETSAPKG